MEACPIAHGISAACLVVLDDAKASPSKRLPAATADSPVANSQSQPTFVSRQLLLVLTDVACMPTEVTGMPAGRFWMLCGRASYAGAVRFVRVARSFLARRAAEPGRRGGPHTFREIAADLFLLL